jgi:hypothetical protein
VRYYRKGCKYRVVELAGAVENERTGMIHGSESLDGWRIVGNDFEPTSDVIAEDDRDEDKW